MSLSGQILKDKGHEYLSSLGNEASISTEQLHTVDQYYMDILPEYKKIVKSMRQHEIELKLTGRCPCFQKERNGPHLDMRLVL